MRACTRQSGFGLVELMVGLVIGLIALMVIGESMQSFEGQKRTTTGGADAQTNGYAALLSMERDIRAAGSGLIGANGRFACENGTFRQYMGTTEAGLSSTPPNDFLPPLRIIAGGSGAGGDAIVIMRSDVTYAGTVGSVLVSPPSISLSGDNCAVAGGLQAPTAEDTSRGQSELFLIAPGPANAAAPECIVVQASAKTDVGSCSASNNELVLKVGSGVPYNDSATWPTSPALGANDLAIPLGQRPYLRYGVVESPAGSGSYRLILADQMKYVSPGYTPDDDIAADNVVYVAAQYGIDTTCTAGLGACSGVAGSQTVDKFISASTAGWTAGSITPDKVARIKAVRVALVIRAQYDKDATSPASITLWDKLNGVDDAPPVFNVPSSYRQYRYRVFETIVPLRNMIWGQL